MKKFFIGALSLSVTSVCVPVVGSTESVSVNLGNVMYVGDSITHGVNSASYRWALHKVFVDNGISYDAVGYKSGNYSNGVAVGATYGGVSFSNQHSSQASARAYHIAGRTYDSKFFDGTNIQNWLNLSTTTNGGTYSGATYNVDTFYLLIGTNDLLSDNTSNFPNDLASKTTNLLGSELDSGDMESIADAMFDHNSNASAIVFSIPCWTTHGNSNSEKAHAAVQTYNTNLETWVSNYNKSKEKDILYVDVNKGILDVTSTTSFFGCSSMFNNPGKDGLHPNAQGDLLIAGNVAKAQGYAGRTVGQTRKDATKFSTNISDFSGEFTSDITVSNTNVSGKTLDFSASGESTLVANWADDDTLEKGFTVDLDLIVGNGETDGWNIEDNFSITLGNGELYGVLNINEAYIQWGDTVLYSTDMSKLSTEGSVRIAYVTGNSVEGVSQGFYVWLDDMLIGEALSKTSGTEKNGVTLSYSGTGNVLLSGFSMDGSGAYAPTTTGVYDSSKAYVMSDVNVSTAAAPQGVLTVPTTTIDPTEKAIGNKTAFYTQTGGKNSNGENIWASVTSDSATAWLAAYGSPSGTTDEAYTFTGNLGLQISGDCTGAPTVFGAVNTGTVNGNVYLDISAESAQFSSFTSTNAASLAGAYNSTISGKLHVAISAGTFNKKVMGGAHTAGEGDYIGQTKIFVNGGTFNDGVYGGGFAGRIGQAVAAYATRSAVAEPASSVTVTDGVISGGVYGGGAGDTINGDTAVTVTGGIISGGIYGGGSAGTINGNTSVTIEGDLPQLRLVSTSDWCAISGGGTGGTISGNATVTLKNIASGNNPNGFDKYAGSISGGTNVSGTSALVLDNVRLDSFNATFSDFDSVTLTNGTATTLTSLGGASTLTLDSETSLTIAENADLSALTKVTLADKAYLAMIFETGSNIVFEVEEGHTFSLVAIGGTKDMDLSGISFSVGGETFDAIATIPDAQAGTIFVSYNIPEPSAFGLLAGLGALVLVSARRRR